jgi:hypothetical protein
VADVLAATQEADFSFSAALTLGGIARNGAVVPIPPVRFEPFKEWRPMLVD